MAEIFNFDSDEVELEVDFPGIDAQVVDYYYVGDGSSYDMHYFIIQVWNGKEKFVVDRSYVDFVVLNRNLVKMYMGSRIPELPLQGLNVIEAVLAKESLNLADYKKRVARDPYLISSRASISDSMKRRSARQKSAMSSGEGHDLFPVPEDSVEVIQAMGPALTLYLVELCCHHELLASEDLHVFLDEEISDLLVPVIPPVLTTFDLALINQSMRSSIVHRIDEHHFKVPAGHYIVWRFSTATFDIGFALELNGKIKLPLTRYRSHEIAICGALQVDDLSDCVMRWDNTYAKCKHPAHLLLSPTDQRHAVHSKQLTWFIRIVSAQEFGNIHLQAMDCLREKKRFEAQRLSLRHGALRHASKLSGVLHGSMLEAEYAEEQALRVKKMEKDPEKLKLQNDLLLSDLEQAEVKLEDLETHCQALVDSKNLLSESWAFSNSQLADAETQLQELQSEIGQLHAHLDEKEHDLQDLLDQLETSHSRLGQAQQTMASIVANLEPKLEMDDRTYEDCSKRLEVRKEALQSLLIDDHAAGISWSDLSAELIDDYQQALAYVSHSQQVLTQIRDILAQLSQPSTDASVALSDF